MFAPLVIRPSGVWNSRAPFSNYFIANREIGLHFNVLLLAACHVRREIEQGKSDKDVRESATRRRDRVAAYALEGYRKSLGRDTKDGRRRQPQPADFVRDLFEARQDVYQLVVLKIASLFETFAQCWALNYLLARLEQRLRWSERDQKLSDQLSPILSSRVPDWPQIMRAVPDIAAELRNLPHIYLDKNTRKEVTAPVSEVLNAFSVVEFWRKYRNLVVHRGGIVSSEFYSRFKPLYVELSGPFGTDIPPLLEHSPLSFSDVLPRAMATTHYYVASHMAKRLVEVSNGRRGHLAAPGPELKLLGTTFVSPKPLLIEGDHALSLKWVRDIDFCRSVAEQLQREGRARDCKPPPLPAQLVTRRLPSPRTMPHRHR